MQHDTKKQTIPVVLSSDNNYAPYLGVCLKSIIDNTSAKNNYHIYVLSSEIDDDYQSRIKEMEKENISICFLDMKPVLKGLDHSLFFCPRTGNNFYSPETYYRLFLPNILKNYNKILYLDCDMIILRDVADLFNIDIGDNFIGATHDLSFLVSERSYSQWSRDFNHYVKNSLLLENLDNYFQAGVMIWNLDKCRKHNLTQKFLEALQRIETPKYVDQDVMNSALSGKGIFWVEQRWNVAWDIEFWYPGFDNLIPDKYADYGKNLLNPWIIHYTSSIKPWNDPKRKNAKYFWQYAKLTAFYEEILLKTAAAPFLKQQPKNSFLSEISVPLLNTALHPFLSKLHYRRCKILAKITFGKTKKHYENKSRYLKQQLKSVKKLLKRK